RLIQRDQRKGGRLALKDGIVLRGSCGYPKGGCSWLLSGCSMHRPCNGAAATRIQALSAPLRQRNAIAFPGSGRGRHQARHKQLRANLLATEDLYETGQYRLHLIDLSLLARYDLTAKFLDFRILDGRPLTHENSRCMMRDHRRQEALVANGGLLPNPQEKGTESDNADCNNDDVGVFVVIH